MSAQWSAMMRMASLGLLLSCAVGCGDGTAPPQGLSDQEAPPSQGATVLPRGESVGAVAEYLRARFPLKYAGVELTTKGIRVYRVPDVVLDAALAKYFDVDLQLIDADHSEHELESIRESVVQAMPELALDGATVAGVSADFDGSNVTVRVTSAEMIPIVRDRFPERVVDVVVGGAIVPA